MVYQLSSFEGPESLFNQCLHYVVDNWEDCLIEKNSWPEKIELKKNTSLPYKICDRILEFFLRKNMTLDHKFLKIFENTENIKLRKIHISKYHLKQETRNIFPLLHHNLTELHYYSKNLFSDSELNEFLQLVNKNGENLKAFSCNEEIFAPVIPSNREDHYDFEDWEYVINAPNLEELNVSGFYQICTSEFFHKLITPLKQVKVLSIVNGTPNQEFLFLTELPNLTSLTIHNINIPENAFEIIEGLTQLKFLDISVSGNYGYYCSSHLILASLIESLPNLVSLDISGTNLDENIMQALQPRMNNPLEFLGLYKTRNEACFENGIPARKIAGNANIEQLLNAGFAFFEKAEMIRKILIDLSHNEDSIENDLLVNFLLKVVDRHPKLGLECQAVFVRILNSDFHHLSKKAKQHILRMTVNMFLKDNVKLHPEFFCNFTPDELFHDVKLIGAVLVRLVKTVVTVEYEDKNYTCDYNFQTILCMADKKQLESVLIEGGVIKALITKIRCAKKTCAKGWNVLWQYTRGNLAISKFFLQEGLLLFEGVMEYLLDHPTKGTREMEEMLILFFSLAQFESIWTEKLKYEKDFIRLLIRALNLTYLQKWFASYYAGCILLKFLSYKADESSIVNKMRDQILNSVQIALKKFPPCDQLKYYLEWDLFDNIISLSKIQDIPECQYWAVIGISWSVEEKGEEYFNHSREEGKNLLKGIIKDESAPASVKKLANNLYIKYFEIVS